MTVMLFSMVVLVVAAVASTVEARGLVLDVGAEARRWRSTIGRRLIVYGSRYSVGTRCKAIRSTAMRIVGYLMMG